MKRFDAEIAQPVRTADLVADLLVPASQSVITGLLAGTLLTLALVGMDFPAPALHIWVGTVLVATTGAWAVLLLNTHETLWKVEQLMDTDLDRDGVVGKRLLEVELKTGRSTLFVGSDFLEMDDNQLLAFAVGISNGRSLAEGEWGKTRTAFPSGVNQYRAFRGRLLDAGLIRAVNPDALNLGYEVTPSGRAVFGRLAEYSHTHTHEGNA